jgi:heme-degrading monooxygenase HmoA
MRHPDPTPSTGLRGRLGARLRAALLLATGTLLGACQMAMPMREVDGAALRELRRDPQARVLVAMTHATLDPKSDRSAFDAHTRRVFDSLKQQPGLLAYAGRSEPFGHQVWTMTVWRDREARRAFVRGATHSRAIEAGMAPVARARFASFEWPASKLPLDWDTALAQLEQHQRTYDYTMR